MTSPEERIKELARKSALDPEAAERLLAAVRPAPLSTGGQKSPFERWSPLTLSLVGIVASLGALALTALFRLRYAGVLDLVAVDVPVSLKVALVDQLLAYPFTAIVFWGVGRLFARHVRLIDVLGAVGLARVPGIAFSIPLAVLGSHLSGPGAKSGLFLNAIILIALVGSALQVTLLVLGFRTATGLRGARLAIAFVVALLGAEFLIKALQVLFSF